MKMQKNNQKLSFPSSIDESEEIGLTPIAKQLDWDGKSIFKHQF